uniref:Uncharacterized protein n=1 Tax=Parascaris equorum TaxID=6256 RepID=A0A914S256_PAREQ
MAILESNDATLVNEMKHLTAILYVNDYRLEAVA